MNNKIRLLILVTILAAAGFLLLSRAPQEPATLPAENIQEKDLEKLSAPAADIQKIPTHASESPDLRAEQLPARPMTAPDRPIAAAKAAPANLQFNVDEDGLAVVCSGFPCR